MRGIVDRRGGGGRRCGASLTDDNAAYGVLDKQNVQIISEQCLIYPIINQNG